MNARRTTAFTLVELLVVIAIVGILAAIVAPSLTHFRKGDAMLAGTRQMMDGVARARQLAISQRTTVYMVFVPPNFWDNTLYANEAAFNALPVSERVKATNILEKQLTGYTFITLRTVGDQPGRGAVRYHSRWQTLPESVFIAPWKFTLDRNQTNFVGLDPITANPYPVTGFERGNFLPFPSEDARYLNPPLGSYISLPYIAFDHLGRLTSGRDEFIPLAHGSISYARDPQTKVPQLDSPSVIESPPNNSTISYNIIRIDWLTGRARAERREVQ